ncbi:CaiB/BaiF CoA transferase family protein [Ilumatobacter sp.]|uniref:CaiB/BaiF CoA transferase family protein n=1 Tax=Ilumatobacter sp. TaxID=1967498 RepID=UPI003C4FDE7C
MTAPLDGVIVVALEQAVAAPLATRHLADLGATVLKVERPDVGDFARNYDSKVNGSSTFFVWANRGKQSITLDMKDEADRATFDALVAGADVFIQNMSPSAAERSGVLASQLVAQHPRLVACDVSGYGLGGPRSDDKAYDLAIQAEGGAMALTGSADEMSKVGFSVADISAAMYAFSSILAALYRRNLTGEGAAISLSMLECLTEWTSVPMYSAVYSGTVPERAGHRHALIAPYGLYALGDGARILVAVQSNRDWATFAGEVLLDPSLVADPRFAENQDRIDNIAAMEAIIADAFGSVPPDEIIERLTSSGVVWARARDPLQVWEHEQHVARDRFMSVDLPTGTARVMKPPFNISDCPDPRPGVPALGEHDPALIEQLRTRADG